MRILMSRRPVTDEDRPFLKHLNEEVYRPVVIEQFGAWDDVFQDQQFEATWSIQNYQIVEQAGQKIGAIWIVKEVDHLWLREIQIRPLLQNRGIGTQLLTEVINEARDLGLPLRLRVLTANRARTLYERLNFKVVGMHTNTHYWMEHPGNLVV